MADGEIDIRPLPPDFRDWPGLLVLIRSAFASMDGVIDPPSSVHVLTPAGLAQKASAETILVARLGKRIIGCVSLDDRGDHLYLGKLAIEPASQARGIGRRLIDAAEAVAIAGGKQALELQTRVELTGNQAFFTRLRFVETGRGVHPGFERPTTITYRRPIATGPARGVSS